VSPKILATNKITAKLSVSVRTVKFHVSSLLEKFAVRGRVDLMLEASAFLRSTKYAKERMASTTSPREVHGVNPAALGPLQHIPLLPAPSPKLRLIEPRHIHSLSTKAPATPPENSGFRAEKLF
jgi:Bacterial regulatory proteins, luxR family